MRFHPVAYCIGMVISQIVVLAACPETGADTGMAKDINTFSGSGSEPWYLTDVDGTLFFAANDEAHATELWKSDGTAAGTIMVMNINTGAGVGSDPLYLTSVNGALFLPPMTAYTTANYGKAGPSTSPGSFSIRQSSGNNEELVFHRTAGKGG